jgi:hypothetical protein
VLSLLVLLHVGNEVSVTTKYFKTESFMRFFVFRVETGVKMKLLTYLISVADVTGSRTPGFVQHSTLARSVGTYRDAKDLP